MDGPVGRTDGTRDGSFEGFIDGVDTRVLLNAVQSKKVTDLDTLHTLEGIDIN
jgi:hypothetical protein